MKWLEKNLECLQNREGLDYDIVYDYIKTKDVEDTEYFVDVARDGNPILGVHRPDKNIMLNSTYKPLQEAEKFAKKIVLRDNAILAFMGIGNGNILAELARNLNEEAQLLVYEPSKELFAFAMYNFDLSPLLSDARVNFFVEGLNEQYFDLTLSYCIDYVNIGVTFLESHPKYKELFSEEYEKFSNEFKDCRESALVNLRTVMEKQTKMVHNAIANVAYLLSSKMSADFIDAFPKDMPVILVSGGPSLDKNYEVLKQAKGKALIIAVDRVARYLLDKDIVPDMFCSLDYSKNLRLFQDERLQDIPFLYNSDLNKEVLNVLGKKNLIFGTTNSLFYNWLIEKFKKKRIELPIGGSVATLAFSFAKICGTRRIILVGQDLALTGGVNYAGGMVSGLSNIHKYDTMLVPGNEEEEVLTRGDLYVYLKWFEQQIKEINQSSDCDIEVINATEGGARIEGTHIMTLQNAVDRYCQEMYDIAAIFDGGSVLVKDEEMKSAITLLEDKGNGLVKLKRKAKEAMEIARRCAVLSERGDYGKEFKDKNKALKKITELFDTAPEANILSSYAEGIMVKEDLDLYVTKENTDDEMIRLYEKMEKNYQFIYENADTVIEIYNDMITRIKADEMGEME